jgi:hypothetical protein
VRIGEKPVKLTINFANSCSSIGPPADCAADGLARDDRWAPFIDALNSFINGTGLDDRSIGCGLCHLRQGGKPQQLTPEERLRRADSRFGCGRAGGSGDNGDIYL